MDENLAVLLGLGLGGIGGYFGSKNRRESEAERLAMLLDAQKPDPNVESDAIKLFKLQEAERARIRKENLLREQEAKADAEALDAEYFSLGDIFVDPFTKGIKKDSVGIPDFLQEGPLVDAASKLFGLAEEGLDNVTSGPLADKVRAGRDKFGEFIANNLVSGPAVDATSDQLRQFQENLTSGPAVDAVSDQLRQLEENLPVTGKAIHDYFYDSGAQLQEDLSGAYDTLYNLGAGTNELYNDILGIPGDIKDFMDYAEIFNQGGRVGLANGGLGYSYKNNIFSADPSTGIPAVVDAGGDDGVADDTFINLFPGLFPPVETPAENILDTPVMPMGGGGGDGPPDFMVGNPGYETFGDLVSDVTSGFGLFGPQTGDYSEDPKARPELSYSPIGSSVDGEEENSFFGFNLPNFADLPTPTNTFFNKLGEIRDFLSDAITNPDTGKGDPDPKPGPKTPSVNSTGGIGEKQKKSGGGGGGGYSGKGTKDPGGQEARGV